jgi:hypothetical protein
MDQAEKTLQRKRAQRYTYLRALYEMTDGDPVSRAHIKDVGANLGIGGAELDSIVGYLNDEGLLKHAGLGGIISITHEGVVEIERSIEAPSEPTEHFPPMTVVNNIVNVGGSMYGSQVLQGSQGGSQAMQTGVTEDLREIVELIRQRLPELGLKDEDQQELKSDLAALQSQAESPKPKGGIIREALTSARRILEGAAGKMVAAPLLAKLGVVIATLGSSM